MNFKILQIIDGLGWGGTKDQMFLLTKMLHAKGLHVEVALSKQFLELKILLSELNIPFFEYQDTDQKSNWRDGKSLATIINEGNYDIAIANSPKVMNQLMWARPFIKNKPTLIAIKRSGRMSSFFSKYLKYSYADKIVVVSENVKKKMENSNFLPKKLLTIPSGIDLNLFTPFPENKEALRKEFGIPSSKKVFMHVANWNEKVKAQPQLMRSFARIQDPNAILILAGYETDTKGKLLAQELGIKNRFIGLGFRSDVHRLIDLTDFFLLSSNLEGIAGALLQAMAKKKVVLSTFAGGIDDYLRHGVNGFGVAIGDFENFTIQLEHLLSLSQQEYEHIANNAMETAKEYSIEKNVNKYIKLFHELSSKKSEAIRPILSPDIAEVGI